MFVERNHAHSFKQTADKEPKNLQADRTHEHSSLSSISCLLWRGYLVLHILLDAETPSREDTHLQARSAGTLSRHKQRSECSDSRWSVVLQPRKSLIASERVVRSEVNSSFASNAFKIYCTKKNILNDLTCN